MKISKRKIVVRSLIACFFIAAIFTKDLYKTFFRATSPNRQFTASLWASCGWGGLIETPDYRVEIADNFSGEHIIAAIQPEMQGWNWFAPVGLKWHSRNEFKCFWNVDAYNGVMSQFFQVKPEPLSATKTDVKP